MTTDNEGEFWTVPIRPSGRQIRLNFRAPMAGKVGIGIEGIAGRSASDCDPLTGDWSDKVVTWNGDSDISAPEGQSIVLHVKLRSAELFSIAFE